MNRFTKLHFNIRLFFHKRIVSNITSTCSNCFKKINPGFSKPLVNKEKLFFIRYSATRARAASLFRFSYHTLTYPIGLLLTSDQLFTEAASYTAYNKHKRRITKSSAGSEHAMTAIERPQIYASGCKTTRIGKRNILSTEIHYTKDE
jgi:hypothetical protein